MGPELSAAETAEATATAIADRGKSLGLTWGLRLATVVDGSNPQAVLATYDGDDVPIGMVSMVGPVVAGARVYAMQVPPGGNFVISQASGPTVQLGTMVGTAGTLVSTAAAEAAVPSANWAAEPTFVFPPGRIFCAEVSGGAFPSLAAARVCGIRIRKGTATTTGTQLAYRPWLVNLIGGVGASHSWSAFFKNTGTSAVSTKLSVTAANPAGAETINLYGDAAQPYLVVVRDYCAVAADANLAAICVSV